MTMIRLLGWVFVARVLGGSVTRMPDVEVTAEDLLVDANDSCW